MRRGTNLREGTDTRSTGRNGTSEAGPPDLQPLLVTVKQAAEMLCISRTTLYELMWREELIPVRIGRSVRLSIEQLQEFVHRQQTTNSSR
jgi:excisionase family DNA binding protein